MKTKTSSKMLALLLSIAMLVSCMTITTFAGTSDYTWDDATGTLTIHTDAGVSTWNGNLTKSDIKTLIIEDGVTTIKENAFHSATGVTEVTIPNTVTKIEQGAFCSCLALNAVTVKGGTDSDLYIGKNVFNPGMYNIPYLETVVIEERTGAVQLDVDAFAYAGNLHDNATLTVPSTVEFLPGAADKTADAIRYYRGTVVVNSGHAFKVAVEDGLDVQLGSDIDVSKTGGATIAAGSEVTLDLNGHDLKVNSSSTNYGNLFVGKDATLILEDNSTAADGRIYSEKIGTLGLIDVGGANSTGATLIMNGGTIDAVVPGLADADQKQYGISAGTEANVTINNGTIRTGYIAVAVGTGCTDATFDIKGGTMTSVNSIAVDIENSPTSTAVITGGTYSDDLTDYDYLADGYAVVDNEDGTFTVVTEEEIALAEMLDILAKNPLSIDQATANTTEAVNALLSELVKDLILDNMEYDDDITIQTVDGSTTNFVAATTNGADGSFDYRVAVVLSDDVYDDGVGTGVITATVADEATKEVVTAGTSAVKPALGKDTAELVITEEDLATGEDIKVVLSVDDVKLADLDAKEQTLVNDTIKALDADQKLGFVLDLALSKFVGAAETEITDLNGKEITITIDVPKEYQADGRAFSVIRVHDGKVTVLDDIDTNSATITFKTGLFSTYAVSYVDADITGGDTGDDDDKDVVPGTPTGDHNTALPIALLVLAMVGMAVVLKKRNLVK